MFNKDCNLYTGAHYPVEGTGDKSYICWIKKKRDNVEYQRLMGECINPSTSKAVLKSQWKIDLGVPAKPQLDYRREIIANHNVTPVIEESREQLA